jgi:hypothetical protein
MSDQWSPTVRRSDVTSACSERVGSTVRSEFAAAKEARVIVLVSCLEQGNSSLSEGKKVSCHTSLARRDGCPIHIFSES